MGVHIHTHPRPQLQRSSWRSLEGSWLFAFDDEARYREPAQVPFDLEIRVPYPPGSPASGIEASGFHPVVWYRTTFRLETHERPEEGSKLFLHFGAVDYGARVWANGQLVAEHQGGHTPFSADVTEVARGSEILEVVVQVQDDPYDMAKPRGKQDWLLRPHSIWYPRTTGIWRTVWLERVPATYIAGLRWTPNLER